MKLLTSSNCSCIIGDRKTARVLVAGERSILYHQEALDGLLFGSRFSIEEPTLDSNEFEGLRVVNDLAVFKQQSDVIIANRHSDELDDVADKLYSRDLFARD